MAAAPAPPQGEGAPGPASQVRAPYGHLAFLQDESISVTLSQIRREIPTLPAVAAEIETVIAGPNDGLNVLAYLALQIQKCQDKELVLRCLASAVAILFKEKENLTGSPATPKVISGVKPEYADIASDDDVTTNLTNSVPVTEGEMAHLTDIDIDELGAYFGVLFLAGVKKVTPDNRTAFNERRAEMVKAQILGPAVIFKSGSPFLDDDVLHKVYATFVSLAAPRCHLVAKTARLMGGIFLGAQTAFAAMFMLLEDTGMGPLRLIKEAALKYDWFLTDFPELKPELTAANKGQLSIRRADVTVRPFLKAIFGNSYVPVSQNEINNAFGLAKYILSKTQPTLARYNGGMYTDEQEQKVIKRLEASGEITPESTNE